MKICIKCGLTFSGRRCKNCLKIYKAAHYKKNAEKIKAHIKKYRESNPELIKKRKSDYGKANRAKINKQKRLYYAANRDKIRVLKAEYREENRLYINEYHVKWCADNRDRRKEHCKKWELAHPGNSRIKNHTRRSRLRGNGGKLSRNIADTLYKLQQGRCACCGMPLGSNYHIDHIIPLALGGQNIDSNIQLLTPFCNDSKGAKHPDEYMSKLKNVGI